MDTRDSVSFLTLDCLHLKVLSDVKVKKTENVNDLFTILSYNEEQH